MSERILNGFWRNAGLSLLVSSMALDLGCVSSTEKVPEDLDVELQRPALDQQSHEIDTSIDSKVASLSLPSGSKIEWRAYFKPAPTLEQRQKLEASLATWDGKGDFQSILKKGRAELALGRLAQAETSFKSIARRFDHAAAYLELTKIYLKQRRMDDLYATLAVLRKNLEMPENESTALAFQYRFVLSLAEITTGELDRARAGLSNLIDLEPDFSPAYAALANTYLKEGKNETALFIAQKGLDRGQDDAALINVMGVVQLREQKLNSARNRFEQALKIDPNYLPAMINLANLRTSNFEFEAAEEILNKAMIVAHDHHLPYLSMAQLRLRQGQSDQAFDLLSKAIHLAPDDPRTRFHLAQINLQDRHNRIEAMRLFSEVLQLTDSSEDLHQMAAMFVDDLRQSKAH